MKTGQKRAIWGDASTTLIDKRRSVGHPGQLRPLATMIILKNAWGCVLMQVANLQAEHLLGDTVFGFRPYRQTSGVTFIWAHLVARVRATNEGFLIGKLDVSRVFDSTDLIVMERAATAYTGPAIARRLVG